MVPAAKLLIGVSRDLSRHQDINEARHRDKVYRCGNGHCQQLGRGDLPAWIPTCHQHPLTRGRGNSEPVELSGARNRAHPAPLLVWLRSLGLGQHEAAFRQNDIDGTVLPNLTAENLKELGVAALGHRRKLLDAIAALRADASAKPPSADTPSPSPSPSYARRAQRGGGEMARGTASHTAALAPTRSARLRRPRK